MKIATSDQHATTAAPYGHDMFFITANYASRSHFGGIAAVLELAADREKYQNVPLIFNVNSNGGGTKPVARKLTKTQILNALDEEVFTGRISPELADTIRARF